MKNTTVRPLYGLSKATLVVTTPKCPEEFRRVNVMRNQVKVGEKIIESNIKNDDAISFVEVGACIGNCEMKIVDDNLVFTARVKDIILIKGENYYWYDIENICLQVNDAKFSKVAVCGVYNHKMKQDQAICFVEYGGELEIFKYISLSIKRHVINKIGISHVIPITVSGKIKRYILLQQFMKGDFDETIQGVLS